MSDKKCDHTIGFEYGEEYGANAGNTITIDDLKYDLSYEIKLKSDDVYQCTFCPDCGVELQPIIEQVLADTKKIYSKTKASR